MAKTGKQPTVSAIAVRHLPEVRDGLFRVDRDGKVYRRAGDRYVLAPQHKTTRTGGYLFVSAMVSKKQKTFLVHRLVAEAYIPNPDNKRNVHHKDGNGHNNHIDNLCWMTNTERVQRMRENGTFKALSTSGSPCIGCGEPTMARGRVCGACRAAEAAKVARDKRAELKATTILDILDAGNWTEMDERRLAMLEMYAKGMTLDNIGAAFMITRERVRQIISVDINKRRRSVSPKRQQELRDYISLIGIKKTAISANAGIPYSKLIRMLEKQGAMLEDDFTRICKVVGLPKNWGAIPKAEEDDNDRAGETGGK